MYFKIDRATTGGIKFPIISFFENECAVISSVEEYTIGKKAYLTTLNSLYEIIIGTDGSIYKRGTVAALSKVNIGTGFSLKYAGFGVYNLSKEMRKLPSISIGELKEYGQKIIDINRSYYEGTLLPTDELWSVFLRLTNKIELLQYLFFFASPERCPLPKQLN